MVRSNGWRSGTRAVATTAIVLTAGTQRMTRNGAKDKKNEIRIVARPGKSEKRTVVRLPANGKRTSEKPNVNDTKIVARLNARRSRTNAIVTIAILADRY